MNDGIVAADRQKIPVVGESHWTIVGGLHGSLRDGP